MAPVQRSDENQDIGEQDEKNICPQAEGCPAKRDVRRRRNDDQRRSRDDRVEAEACHYGAREELGADQPTISIVQPTLQPCQGAGRWIWPWVCDSRQERAQRVAGRVAGRYVTQRGEGVLAVSGGESVEDRVGARLECIDEISGSRSRLVALDPPQHEKQAHEDDVN